MSYLTNFRNEDAGALFGAFRGATCFLICGGPSLRAMDLAPLQARGIITAAVNNVAATLIRPSLWFSFDEPGHFSETIWCDPAIMKFCREDRLALRVAAFDPASQRFVAGQHLVRDCPNVWGYKVTNGWTPREFLTSRMPTGGVEDHKQDPEGRAYYKTVMFPALRILYDLGFRRIYLLGADFHMTEASPYAFDETATASKIEQNNGMFGWINRRLEEAKPYMDLAKFKIWNATPGSALTAFEHVDYNDVVKREVARVEQTPVTRGHYQ